MGKHSITVAFRLQHLYRDHERGDRYSVQIAPNADEGGLPEAVGTAPKRELREISGRPRNGSGAQESRGRIGGPGRAESFVSPTTRSRHCHRAPPSTGPARPSNAMTRATV